LDETGMLSHASQTDETPGEYTVRQAARVLGLPERRLRYWSQTGFISPTVRRGGRLFYSFRDLIALKVAKALLDGGLTLRRVRRTLQALESRLPRVDASLAGLRIRCDADRILVDDAEHSFEAGTGQLVLDFDVASLEREAARVLTLPWVEDDAPQPGSSEPLSAYDWFLEAIELEQQWGGAPADVAGFEAARSAYERSVELDPGLAAAWTNLGSLLAEVGDIDGARDHYERALACDPDQPEAQCNLAELLLRAGEVDAAISAYRSVLRAAPEWFEAHYGLARALLLVGGKGQALAHLERFCQAVERMPADEQGEELAARRACAQIVIGDLRRELAR
jgi:tetratricopeptide (TPR) repeat protein